jgi:4-amino-4-deoxy-L-arabinose transferase-like glycosyltransferase
VADEGSVATPAHAVRAVRATFWTVWLLSTIVKLVLAGTLAPFGDEAFYWQESRQLAWSYSDLPPATAWLIRLGNEVFGSGEFGMRSMFLVLGAAIPILLLRFATRLSGARAGYFAALGWCALPLGGTLGVMAMPDVPLTFAMLLALDALERAARDDRWRDWSLLGVAMALAWLSHYRAAMLVLAGIVFAVATVRGRASLRLAGWWFAFGSGRLGLAPLLWFNARHGWTGLSFQLVERHPWSFHADAFAQPLEQAIACTPVLYVLMLATLWACIRRRRDGAPWDLLASSAAAIVIGYFVLGLFADDVRFRAHWPLPGYLPLLAALPVVFAVRGRAWMRVAIAVGLVGTVGALAYLGLAAHPRGTASLAGMKVFPYNFVGWHEAGDRTRAWLRHDGRGAPVLVADNFLLGAELDFALDGAQPVYVLDHARNHKHGRTAQLALWQRDETAIARLGTTPVLLVVEETTGRVEDRAAWQRGLCRRVGNLRLLERMRLFDGRKVFAWYAGSLPAGTDAADCASDPSASP